MIKLSSFRKHSVMLTTSLICALSIINVANASKGNLDKDVIYKDWLSARLCTLERCVWRAATISPIDFQNPWVFTIDKERNGNILINMQSNISLESARSWGDNDFDIVNLKLRIDHKKTREVKCVRTLDKNSLDLYWRISVDDQDQFISELKNGNTLRIRIYNGEHKFTIPFSLSGAYAAIGRALTEDYSYSNDSNSNRPDTFNYDPFFDDKPSSRI